MSKRESDLEGWYVMATVGIVGIVGIFAILLVANVSPLDVFAGDILSSESLNKAGMAMRVA